MANANKAKGNAAERAVRDFLQGYGIECDRIPAGATNDTGDVIVYRKNWPAIQIKNQKAMSLGTWITEAQQQAQNAKRATAIVVHKRKGKGNPADWYVTTTLAEFLQLMEGNDETR